MDIGQDLIASYSISSTVKPPGLVTFNVNKDGTIRIKGDAVFSKEEIRTVQGLLAPHLDTKKPSQ